MMTFPRQPESIQSHLKISPEVQRLLELGNDSLDGEMVEAILDQAVRFSSEILTPFDAVSDKVGASFEGGRVTLAPGHDAAWLMFREAGWLGLEMDPDFGGQGLAKPLAAGVTEIMERGSVAFGMLAGSIRGASRLLALHAPETTKEEWLPRLLSGEWGATICISEPDAGSDVGRIRTRAVARGASWEITGEKIWISYGDNPLVTRNGHLVLARIEGALPGTRGLSLFLVPSGSAPREENGVTCRRIEEKMGLHGSPTCSIGFEKSLGTLIGQEGRGLPTLFAMITGMRLQVGAQGLGLASAMLETAVGYAAERKQGGPADKPPVPINQHADVRLMLLNMATNVETFRGVVTAAASFAELAEKEDSEEARARAAALVRFLLPVVKNGGAELAWNVGSLALLVLGGAGYTQEWPVERWLRDCRVLAVFEGTTGMQGQDLTLRRMLADDEGLKHFCALFESELSSGQAPAPPWAEEALQLMREASRWVRESSRTQCELEAAATIFLRFTTIVLQTWSAARLVNSGSEQLAAIGAAWGQDVIHDARALLERAMVSAGRLIALAKD
ncbi:acyl-CoA dehydrogenase family protein [Sphingobium nicotianae]|uniref:Acyl-CoA dehydrogenase family protein n=1 Tax=Sphingobium nicotianae TaxID=2782607 RepID=A0A9X1D9X5_9SPHN|nr:acyl-CoA dehydrogenase family protein [Sphingobium nicotianae]MBT2186082.1 acyl-CoA dehydrogenase family protein [Sphingobium nicotianae]